VTRARGLGQMAACARDCARLRMVGGILRQDRLGTVAIAIVTICCASWGVLLVRHCVFGHVALTELSHRRLALASRVVGRVLARGTDTT
jgi:hypothetical protein